MSTRILIRILLTIGIVFSSIPMQPAIALPAAILPAVEPSARDAKSPVAALETTATPFASPLPTPSPTLTPAVTQTTILTPTLGLTPTQALMSAAGGRLQSTDKRIQLDVPPGLFKRSTRLSITPRQTPAANAPRGMALQFDLDARDTLDSTAITEFEQPITLTVDLNGVVDRAALKPYEHLALFHESGSPDAPWAEMVDAVEIRPGVLQVKVSHFSGGGGGSSGDAPAGWHLKYNPPVASLFSGAATFNYPLEVPAGRNGLQPSLALAYNSRSVDGVMGLGSEDMDGVPPGWSLDLASISRNRVETDFCGDCGGTYPTSLNIHPDFSLSINGASYDLFAATTGHAGRYYVKDNPGLYVERRNDTGWNGSPDNLSHEYWIVKTGDGATYRFGYNTESEQTETMGPAHFLHCLDGGYCGYVAGTDATRPATGTAPVRWRVDQITDLYGNQITVTYQTRSTSETFAGSGELTVEHTQPLEIHYNFVSGSATSRVVFTNTGGVHNWIDQIRVYHGGLTNKVREYQLGWDTSRWWLLAITQTNAAGNQWLPPTTFTYSELSHGENWYGDEVYTPYLTRVDNGYGGATEFSYLSDGRREPGGAYGFSYRVSETRTYDGLNATPARVQYAYGLPCYDQIDTLSPLVTFCRSVWPPKYSPVFGHNSVTQTVLALNGSVMSRDVHHYNIDDNMYQDPPLRGREITATTDAGAGSAVLTRVTHEYQTQTINGLPFTFLGQQDNTAYDGGLTAARTVSYTYDSYGNQTNQYEPGDGGTTLDDRMSQSVFYPNTSVTTIPGVTYRAIGSSAAASNSAAAPLAYDGDYNTLWDSTCYAGPNHRQWLAVWFTGGAQTVDVIKFKLAAGFETGYEIYYDNGGVWTRLYPTPHDDASGEVALRLATPVTTPGFKIDAPTLGGSPGEYCFKVVELRLGRTPGPNTGQWVVGKPGYTNVYSWTNNTWSLMKSTIFSYDNHPVYNTPVITGELTAVRAWTGVSPTLFIDTRYTYDQWGNRLTETTYDDLGMAGAYATLNPKTITTTYDSTYQLYPIVVTNATGHTVQYQYYGLNESDPGVGAGPVGALKRVTDPNSAATWYTYDNFGRLKKVIRPGDTLTYPTDSYAYYDGGDGEKPLTAWPLQVVHIQQKTAGVAGCSGGWGGWERIYYDGLGRVIQQQRPLQDWTCTGGQMAVTYSGYNAVGQVMTQSVPYAVVDTATNGLSHYQTPDLNQPRSVTQYDALGRVITQTAPDNSRTIHRYGLYNDAGQTITYDDVQDANRHRKQYRTDSLGRLVKVIEMTGDCHPGGLWGMTCVAPYTTPWLTYATTRYTYDALGQLRIVTDALTNTTVITYDVLGRKTGMIDPDMGKWTYQYDTAGNLITQTDALNQSLIFAYDNLNRLTGKWYSTTLALTKVATYTYDTGSVPNQKGYRTRMDDPSGWATWAYDTRGRVVSETKAITVSSGTLNRFTTQYGYDGLDRVVTTTYPTGEVITQTYNKQGALENMKSASSGAPYNGQWYANNLDYNANGSVALMQLGNSVNVTSTYFPLNFRLQRLQIGGAQAFNYLYDNVGNVLTLTTQITQPVISTEALTFKYDALDRLTNAVSVTNGYTGTYGYNAIGNLITKTESAAPIIYTYGVTQPHAVRSLTNGGQYQYNLNGNMTSRIENNVTYTQTWDAENRLTIVTSTASAVKPVSKFTYDGDGARVLQVQISGTQIITTAYAGAIEVQITGTQRITKTYYSAGSQLIAMRQYTSPTSSVLYFLHSDHLGSVSVTTCGAGCGTAGTVLSRQKFDAWGNLRSGGVGSMPTDVGFTSQRSDSYIKLVQMGARWYDPEIGRWLSPDTIVPDPANPQSLNRFGYVYNNPLKHTDPSGHCAKDDAVCEAYKTYLLETYGIDLLDGTAICQAAEAKLVYDTLYDIAAKFAEVVTWRNVADLMKAAWGGTAIVRNHDSIFGGAWTSSRGGESVIHMPDNPLSWSKFTIAEELGHAWDISGEIFGGLNGGPISWAMPSYVGSDTAYLPLGLLQNSTSQHQSFCILAYFCLNYDPGRTEGTAIPLPGGLRNNPVEDWGTAFAQFVEPLPQGNLGPRREQFVKLQIALLVTAIGK